VLPFPELDFVAPVPATAQIAGFYRQAIADGRLPVGARLPPIRDVAAACELPRTTVQEAYRELADQGLVAGSVGRGTTVIARPAGSAAPTPLAAHPLSPYGEAALRRQQGMAGAPELRRGQTLVANFAELSPDGERFPVDDWRAAMDAVLRSRGAQLLGYGHGGGGLPELRALLAARQREVDPELGVEEVLITAGAQQALDLLLRTFCAAGDTVVVTAPSYHQMHGLLRAHGLQVIQVPFTADGIDLEALRRALQRKGVRLVYLMPTFHNPTGRTLTPVQRQALLEVLAPTTVPIVEDEYQSSLRFRGAALPSLRSLDRRGLTLTVSTMSKELFPALRLGWIAGAEPLLRPLMAVKRCMDLETSPLLQAALVEFVGRGALDRYQDALRLELATRHAALQAAARELPPDCRLTDPDGGYLAWLELPESAPAGAGDRLAELAGERGVRTAPGRIFDIDLRPSRGVRLSLSRATSQQIAAGMGVLAECCRELLDAPVLARPFL
jgi:DNA-binding transcriptional MocR family regulator